MSLLSKLLRSPEILTALGVGGIGAMTSGEEDDPLARGLAGGAIGLASGGAGRKLVKGLLSRVPTQLVTQQAKNQQALAVRRAFGQTGSAATQFPSGTAMSELDKYAEMLAQQKYGDRIGMNGIDRAIEGVDEVSRLGTRLWDGFDNVVERAMPTDRIRDLKNFAGENAGTLIGTGILGAGAGAAAMFAQAIKDGKENGTRDAALQALGFDSTENGIKMFQATNGLPLSGQWDDDTIVAAAKALAKQREEAAAAQEAAAAEAAAAAKKKKR